MKTVALIVAAGRGTRLGAAVPKQYIPLNGAPALRRSVELFLAMPEIAQVRCVIHSDDAERYADAVEALTRERLNAPVHGGATRAASVRAGLEAFADEAPDAVLIHDAARPFMPESVIRGVIDALADHDGACAGLPVVDALWHAEDTMASASLPRDGLWRAQTPQGFRFDAILAAHRAHAGDGADDVAVAREAGIAVKFVSGSELGYKITTQQDLDRALRETSPV
ncbi:MAG: 2-C-methyl-D-erythritol 4-phosphate cytidylyltransferase [Paracoccaceae bacterium]